MTQENSVGKIDELFHQQAHHHRKVDEPNLFISKIHDLIANNTLGG